MLEKNDPWLIPNNGGQKTLEQYKKLAEEDRVKILDYIKNMLLQKEVVIEDTTFLISHSCFLGTTDGLNEPMMFGDVYWKDVSYYDALDVVWFSPWRMWEYAPLKNYESDGRIHIIGHVPVLRIEAQDWPDGVIPEMPSAYINHNIINVDVGCAMMKTYKDFRPEHLALCCVCLDKYVKGEGAFTYIEKENRKTSK